MTKKHTEPIHVKKHIEPDSKIKTGPKTNKMKEKNETDRVFRHIGFPKDVYNDMQDENTFEKRKTDQRISTEETIIALVTEGIQRRKQIRATEK